MRILIISQYFWPESFRINDIAQGLLERGHDVIVLTGKPNYPNGKFYEGYSFFGKPNEEWNGLKIFRVPLIARGRGGGIRLFMNYISFAVLASFRVLWMKKDFDSVLVYGISPVTVGIPAVIFKKLFKKPFFFWVQDLWPASLTAAAGIKNRLVIGVFERITRMIYNSSSTLLVQSKAFIPYILNQNIEESKIIYYPNSTENYYKELKPDEDLLKSLPHGKKIMFAGNIGESQSFETLLNAALLLKNEKIKVQWIILGEGRMKEVVNQRVKELNLKDVFHLLGAFPSTLMPKYFSCADALLVSLKKDKIFSYTIPSKIQSYLACGKPILTSLDGEGSRIIQEANAGFTSLAEDPIALASIIKKFLSLNENEQKALGKNARKYFQVEFEREMLVDRLEFILS